MVAEDFTLSTCDVRWPVAYSQGFAQIRMTLPVPIPRSPTAEEIAPPSYVRRCIGALPMPINLNLFKIALAVYGAALLLMLAVPYFEQAIRKGSASLRRDRALPVRSRMGAILAFTLPRVAATPASMDSHSVKPRDL